MYKNKGRLLLRQDAFRIAAIYATFGFVWILYSEGLLRLLFTNPNILEFIAYNKDSIYILITSCLIYILVTCHISKIKRVEHAIERRETRLQQIHSNKPSDNLVKRALRISAVYVVVGLIWIGFFDHVLATIVDDSTALLTISTYKNSIYILATACLVYYFVWAHASKLLYVEQSLRSSGLLLQQILDNTTALVSVKDTKGNYALTNSRFDRLVRISGDKVVGKNDIDIFGKAYADTYQHHDNLVLHNNYSMQFEESIPHGDGIHDYVSIKFPLFSEEKEPYAVCTISTDITYRRKTEQVLRESEERFKDFAKTAADWFWEIDKNYNFSYLSDRFREVSGKSLDPLIGSPISDLFADQIDEDRLVTQLFQILNDRKVISDYKLNWKRKDGKSRVFRVSGKPRFDSKNNFLGYRGTGRDVTDAHRLAQKIAHQATHDSLTELVNRGEFELRLQETLRNAGEYNVEHALCYLDLDQFKIINDVAGHVAGDALLKKIANALKEKIRSGDTLARIGGDEFGLILVNCPISKAANIADSLVQSIRNLKFSWDGRPFYIGVSIGLVPITADAENTTELLRRADVACYTAKDMGRNGVRVYGGEDNEVKQHQADILHAVEITDAIRQNRFRIYGQPIISLENDNSRIKSYELLLRLINKQGDIVLPSEFIPAAERYGVMSTIDRWVIDQVFEKNQQFINGVGDVQLSINLSANSLNDETFLEYLQNLLNECDTNGERICFEITETAVIRNLSRAVFFINEMKKSGCRFALDDFGSGLSSFSYLRQLPVDYLKIDGSFVKDIAHDRFNYSIVRAINEISHNVGIRTVAEGAESKSDIENLIDLNVDYAQGFAIGHPEPLEVLLADEARSPELLIAN